MAYPRPLLSAKTAHGVFEGGLEQSHDARALEAHLKRTTPARLTAEPLVPLPRLLEPGPAVSEPAHHDAPNERRCANRAESTNEKDHPTKYIETVVRKQPLERRRESGVACGHRGLRDR